MRVVLVVVLSGVLTLADNPGSRSPSPPGDAAARDAVACIHNDPAPSTYLVVVMLIAERDGLAVPGLIAEIRRGVARLDRTRAGDRGLLAAAFALAAAAEVRDDPAAAEAHLAAAAQLIDEAGPGASGAAMVLGATELARTARDFGDPRAEEWLRKAVAASRSPAAASRAVQKLAAAELVSRPTTYRDGARPHCAYDRVAALSLNPLHRPTSDDTITAALLAAASPRRW